MTVNIDEVKIDDPATMGIGSDRYPGTVTGVTYVKSGPNKGRVATVTVTEDDARMVTGSTQDGSATWEYSRNPEGRSYTFQARNRGRTVWQSAGRGWTLYLGARRRYYDPHI